MLKTDIFHNYSKRQAVNRNHALKHIQGYTQGKKTPFKENEAKFKNADDVRNHMDVRFKYDFNEKDVLKVLRHCHGLFAKCGNPSGQVQPCPFGTKSIFTDSCDRLTLLSVKEKKQIDLDDHYYSQTYKNKEFIFTDDKMVVLDFSTGEITFEKNLYSVWDPRGQPWWMRRNGDKLRIVFKEDRNLFLVEGDYSGDKSTFNKYLLDTEVVGHLERDNTAKLQKKMFKFYLKRISYQVCEIKEIILKKNLSTGSPWSVRNSKIMIDTSDCFCGSMRLFYNEQKKLIFLVKVKEMRSGKLNKKTKKKKMFISIYSSRTKRLIRKLVINCKGSEFIDQILMKKSEFVLRTSNFTYLVNYRKMTLFHNDCRPYHQIFYTKDRDYLAHSTGRFKFLNGLTFIDVRFFGLSNFQVYDIVRLKTGDFIAKVDYGILRFYYNLTKKHVEYVLRIDLPSKVQSHYNIGCLNSTPNINCLRKFYTKILDVDTMKIDLISHREFKTETKDFNKRFETIKTLENSTKIYLEATRNIDMSMASSFFRKQIDSNVKYKNLYCIEYDYSTKKIGIFNLPSSHNNGFVVLGEDKGWEYSSKKAMKEKKSYLKDSQGVVYLADTKRRLIRLTRHQGKSEFVDLTWLDAVISSGSSGDEESPVNRKFKFVYDKTVPFELQLEKKKKVAIMDRQNFGKLKKDNLLKKYFFFGGKMYFANSTSLVFIDLFNETKRVLIENFKKHENLILYHIPSKKQLLIFNNSPIIRVLNLKDNGGPGNIWEYSLDWTPIPNFNPNFNFLKTENEQFKLISKDKIYCFEIENFSIPESESNKTKGNLRIKEVLLNYNSDIKKVKTVEIKGQYYKVVSGECIFNLQTQQYKVWTLKNQFRYLKEFCSNFEKSKTDHRPSLEEVYRYDKNSLFDQLDRLYHQALKFKQMGFHVFEMGLDFTRFLCRYGNDEKLEVYLSTAEVFLFKSFKKFVDVDVSYPEGGSLINRVKEGIISKKEKKSKKRIEMFMMKLNQDKKLSRKAKNKKTTTQPELKPGRKFSEFIKNFDFEENNLPPQIGSHVPGGSSNLNNLSTDSVDYFGGMAQSAFMDQAEFVDNSKKMQTKKKSKFKLFGLFKKKKEKKEDKEGNRQKQKELFDFENQVETTLFNLGRIWYYGGSYGSSNSRKTRIKRVFVELCSAKFYSVSKKSSRTRCMRVLKGCDSL